MLPTCTFDMIKKVRQVTHKRNVNSYKLSVFFKANYQGTDYVMLSTIIFSAKQSFTGKYMYAVLSSCGNKQTTFNQTHQTFS